MRAANHIATMFFCIAGLLLSGCTGAMTGVSGTALVRSGYPRCTISTNEPFTLQGYGRLWVSLPTEFLGFAPSGSMDYAVSSDAGEGPVVRHAHSLIVRPSDDIRWRFRPESFKPFGGLSLVKQDINGYRWTVQILRVDAERDWFSAMWRENGRETPEFWIARRFSATPEQATRVVAEYREAWPDCLEPEASDLVFVRRECLEGFLERSDAAFLLDMHASEIIEEPSASSRLQRPGGAPDMKKLAGELVEDSFRYRLWR